MRDVRLAALAVLVLFSGSALAAGGVENNAGGGGNSGAGKLAAQRWCSSCHVVGPDQINAVPQGPPPFVSLAKDNTMTSDRLRGSLAMPHPPMPELSLSRATVDDLIAYIKSLR